ncbi:MAG TPA: TIGR02588 family protein [Stenomitos sp.]
MNTQSKKIQPQDLPKRSLAEWITFGIAVAILSTVIGLVSYVWLGKERQPPVLSITYEKTIRKVDGQFYVPFILINKGGETVESVRVYAELVINSDFKEQSEQEIDFLSSGEVQEGAFIFSKNPQEGKLKLKVESYKLP